MRVTDDAQAWSTEEVVGLLQRVDLFEGLPDEDLIEIAGIVDGVTAKPEEVLFEEGEPGDAFYIVFKGAIQILKTRADDTEEKLAVRRDGEGFGEMALLNDAPRSATARALERTQLLRIPRAGLTELLGGDTLAFRMMQGLSTALRALGVRFASAEKIQDPGARVRAEVDDISRLMQAGFLPSTAPRVDGFDVACGTITVETGRGGTAWDWMEMGEGRTALLSYDVRQDGFPAAHHVGVARGVLRALGVDHPDPADLLQRANESMSAAGVEGVDQFVETGVLVVTPDGLEWASAGRVPGGIVRHGGDFEEFGAHGPPLGMMGGFKYTVERYTMRAGDIAFVLSHGSTGLLTGAADLIAARHKKPAGELVSTLHRAMRKAQDAESAETSVLFVRKK
jgi:CRP-like cAMP-binding protein